MSPHDAEADNKQEGASAVENITPLGKPTTCGEIADVPVRIEGGTFIMGRRKSMLKKVRCAKPMSILSGLIRTK